MRHTDGNACVRAGGPRERLRVFARSQTLLLGDVPVLDAHVVPSTRAAVVGVREPGNVTCKPRREDSPAHMSRGFRRGGMASRTRTSGVNVGVAHDGQLGGDDDGAVALERQRALEEVGGGPHARTDHDHVRRQALPSLQRDRRAQRRVVVWARGANEGAESMKPDAKKRATSGAGVFVAGCAAHVPAATNWSTTAFMKNLTPFSSWSFCMAVPTLTPRTRSNGTSSMPMTVTDVATLVRTDAASMPMNDEPITTTFGLGSARSKMAVEQVEAADGTNAGTGANAGTERTRTGGVRSACAGEGGYGQTRANARFDVYVGEGGYGQTRAGGV